VLQNQKISGVLVKRNFNYHIMAPSDLPTYTELATSTVTQRQSVPFLGNFSHLQYFLNQLSGDAERVEPASSSSSASTPSGPTVRVFGGAVSVTAEQPRYVVIEWVASPINDMYADSVLAVVLKAESVTPPTRLVTPIGKIDKSHFNECVMELLTEMFGAGCIDPMIRGDRVRMSVDGKTVWINLGSLDVQCDEDDMLQQMISTAVAKLHRAITPVEVN